MRALVVQAPQSHSYSDGAASLLLRLACAATAVCLPSARAAPAKRTRRLRAICRSQARCSRLPALPRRTAGAQPFIMPHLCSLPFLWLAMNTPLLGSEVDRPFQCSIISGWHSASAALWFLAALPRASGCFSCRTRPLAPTCECKFLTYAAVAPRVDRSASVAMMTVAHRRFSHR